MRPFPILLAVLTLCGAIGVVSWWSRPPEVEEPLVNELGQASDNPFTIAESGPYPVAVLEEPLHDFGRMVLGGEKEHTFTIRNDGEAPLTLHKGNVACKCTVPTVSEHPIPPGESGEVVMTWKPLDPTEAFDKWAIIWTNDPANEKLELRITGKVLERVTIGPPTPWVVNQVSGGKEMTFQGGIISGMEQFNVVRIESTAEWLTTETTPMEPEDVEMYGLPEGFGHFINVNVEPDMIPGRFHEQITVVTDIDGESPIDIPITGTKPGPFSILGQGWVGGDMTMRMGKVSAEEGKTLTVSMFIDREEEPIKLSSVEMEPDFAQLSLERDETFDAKVKEKYLLTFTIPPGSPVGLYQGDDRVDFHVHTTRESLPEIKLSMEAIIE